MKQKSGFTLIELSIVLIIISLIIGMTVASGVSAISSARLVATNNKMTAIDHALMAFRVANNRIPCPSDLSQVQGSATYGTEGACTAIAGGVFVAQNGAATATAAEGGIPTVALGLPNDFMYDGWGNRIRYAVDTGMTTMGAFSGSQIGGVCGAITINTGSTVAYPAAIPISTGAVYALISHGANGHGAVTKNASVYNAGSLNTDELTNCHCTSTGAAGTYAPTYVKQMPYTYKAIAQANSNYNFDDIVTFKERWQMRTTWDMVGTGCSGGVYSRTITIDHTKVGTVNNTDQTNFPLLFSGTYAYLATVANGGNVTNASGYDITFTSDAAGKIVLPFEQESYNATTGAVNYWVQVPNVSHTADTVIYLQYDNSAITTDQSNKTRTWSNSYVGVWHMDENPTSSAPQINDSTSTGNNATVGGTWAANQQTAGKIGGSLNFNTASTDYATASDIHAVDNSSYLTIEGWVNPTTTNVDYPVLLEANHDGNNFFRLQQSGAGDCGITGTALEMGIENGSNNNGVCTGSVLSAGTWKHVVMVFDGTQSTNAGKVKIYVNGTSQTLAFIGTFPSKTANLTQSLFMGKQFDNSGYYNGLMDEFRLSNTARSADWIITEYNNQNSPSTFYTVGAAVSR